MPAKEKMPLSEKKQYISIILCATLYTLIYFGRYTYSANIAVIEDFYKVSHSEAGLVMSFFAIAYGLGQIVHGIFCKKYPKKIIVPIVLLVPAAMDFLVFWGVPFGMIKYMWFISAVVQSALWPLMLQVLSENVDDAHMKKGILVFSLTTSVGTLLVYGTSALFAGINFKYTFLTGTVLLAICAVLWVLFYEPANYLEAEGERTPDAPKEKVKKRYIIIPVALLIVFSIVINFEKDGLQTWVPAILKNLHGMKDSLSIILTLVLPLFGIFGAALSVFLNEKISSILSLIILFFSFVAIFDAAVIFFQKNIFIMLGSFGLLELLLHGLSSVTTTIFPLYMRRVISGGTLTGILNGSAYIGSATSSYLLGKIADVSGWTAVFVTLLGAIVAVLIMAICYHFIAARNRRLKF